MVNQILLGIQNWANSLNANDVQLWVAVIQSLGTIIAAILAVIVAFWQIKRHFENKVIYEGWKEFQNRLFKFSSAFTNFSSRVGWLKYVIDSQDNSLVNKGNKMQYRADKWQELSDSHQQFQLANVAFLRSFETHQMVFLKLAKMKSVFQKEVRAKINDPYFDFEEMVFPEMHGVKSNHTNDELKQIVKQYQDDIDNTGIFLEDFRTELQNVSIGKVLRKTAPSRQPDKGYKILTRKGFVIQKHQPKREEEDL